MNNQREPPVPRPPGDIHVYLGSINFMGGERIAVKRIIRRQDFKPKTLDHDVALLELAAEPRNKIGLKLIQLATATHNEASHPGRSATVVGWGSTLQGDIPQELRRSSETLKYAEVRFKPTDRCNRNHLDRRRALTFQTLRQEGKSEEESKTLLDKLYPAGAQVISDNMICAGTEEGSQDFCFGDSGGPLVVKWAGNDIQVGIVSWLAGGCGLTDLYSVYVRVSGYADWIVSKIK
jgi:secreted trypsin-like serine protease